MYLSFAYDIYASQNPFKPLVTSNNHVMSLVLYVLIIAHLTSYCISHLNKLLFPFPFVIRHRNLQERIACFLSFKVVYLIKVSSLEGYNLPIIGVVFALKCIYLEYIIKYFIVFFTNYLTFGVFTFQT